MPLKLKLTTAPDAPLEAYGITPESLAGMNATTAAKQILMHGNEKACIGDFFEVSGEANGEIQLQGDLSRVKHIGNEMTSGKIEIDGNVGAHLGAAMSGGEITVHGDAGDWLGPEMSGGRITIKGNAGHMPGSAYRGSLAGITGGEIIIHGNVRNELGNSMRNGLIVVGGTTGDFTGVNMLAGTIVVLGEMGIRTGAGMKRGSIISMQAAEILPTFEHACQYRPNFLRVLLIYLQKLGMAITDEQLNGEYDRWCGDSVEINRGEILLLSS